MTSVFVCLDARARTGADRGAHPTKHADHHRTFRTLPSSSDHWSCSPQKLQPRVSSILASTLATQPEAARPRYQLSEQSCRAVPSTQLPRTLVIDFERQIFEDVTKNAQYRAIPTPEPSSVFARCLFLSTGAVLLDFAFNISVIRSPDPLQLLRRDSRNFTLRYSWFTYASR